MILSNIYNCYYFENEIIKVLLRKCMHTYSIGKSIFDTDEKGKELKRLTAARH